jgi:predicted RNase H-like HicB family nuclease
MPALGVSSKIDAMKTYNLDVKLSKQEDGLWRAEVPGLQGCWVDAPTLRQALHDIQEAAAMFIDIYEERGETLPAFLAAGGEIHHATVPLILGEFAFKKPRLRSRARSAVR